MDLTPIKILRFSTDDFPEQKRVEAYREIYGRTIIKHDIEPTGGRPFHFAATLCGLPGLGLASTTTSPCRRVHAPHHIDNDDLVLGIGFTGGCAVHQRGREAVLDAGEAVLMSSADPSVVHIGPTSRSTILRLPYRVIRSRNSEVDERVARKMLQGTAGKLLTSYLNAIWTTQAVMKPELHEVVVTHVYDLVCLMLGANGDEGALAEQRGARAARRAAIMRLIESRSSDPNLSVTEVAASLGVSARYVHVLLEETGQSFTHHVRRQRLERAAALLRDPLWRERRITDVALEAGFTDLSHFSRTFRKHFGAAPSDIRAAMRWQM